MANAWCINAIWFDWSLIRTLQNLDSSNIWVWVQFTAPNPLDDKRFDYIKYTDKCWNTCCLTWENEILIYATNWTIKNLTLTNDDANEVVNVKRSDVFWSNRKKTVVRYKTWSYPTSITDWTLAVEELVQNQYSSSWYNVSWLEDWTTYYFSAFAVAQDDTIIVVQTNSITPSFDWKPDSNTIAWYLLDNVKTTTDSSWRWNNLTNTWWTFQNNSVYLNWSSFLTFQSNFMNWRNARTIAFRVKPTNWTWTIFARQYDNVWSWPTILLWWTHSNWWAWVNWTPNILSVWTYNAWWRITYNQAIPNDSRTCVVISCNSLQAKLYVNWTRVHVVNWDFSINNWNWYTWMRIWQRWWWAWLHRFTWYIWRFAIENVVIADSRATDFYNKTKSKFL